MNNEYTFNVPECVKEIFEKHGFVVNESYNVEVLDEDNFAVTIDTSDGITGFVIHLFAEGRCGCGGCRNITLVDHTPISVKWTKGRTPPHDILGPLYAEMIGHLIQSFVNRAGEVGL